MKGINAFLRNRVSQKSFRGFLLCVSLGEFLCICPHEAVTHAEQTLTPYYKINFLLKSKVPAPGILLQPCAMNEDTTLEVFIMCILALKTLSGLEIKHHK